MFLSHVFVWLGSRRARLGQILLMDIGVRGHQTQHHTQHLGNLLAQQQRRQQRLQRGVHIGMVDANRFWQISVVTSAVGGQSLQVVAQHLGCNILHHRQLRQTRDVLQIEPMLEPLECPSSMRQRWWYRSANVKRREKFAPHP